MGLPSLQALVEGGHLCLCHTFFRGGGGLENYLGLGAGSESGVWEGVLFFVSAVVFCGFCAFHLTNCNFSCRHAM